MKINAVSLNETRCYTIREEDKKYIKEIRGVYAYNPESCTHLCELTPSYDLRFLYTYIVLNTLAVVTTCEDEDDSIEEFAEELEQRYCFESNEDIYMHCADVRACKEVKECGEFETFEEGYEYLQGNCPF
jgi:hypothetical protein